MLIRDNFVEKKKPSDQWQLQMSWKARNAILKKVGDKFGLGWTIGFDPIDIIEYACPHINPLNWAPQNPNKYLGSGL